MAVGNEKIALGEENLDGAVQPGQWSPSHYRFTCTDNHLKPSDINPLRYTFDELSSQALERLQKLAKSSSTSSSTTECPALDLYRVLETNHANDPILAEFWNQLNSVPDWVDWEQLERAQLVFYRHAVANLFGFALQGFIGENSAARGVVEVLVRTGGFSTRVLLHRLMETFQWLLQVTESLEAIRPGGEAWKSTVRVRLLHASVRQRICRLAEKRPDYFDIQRYGVPTNTLDSIHSIATFCCNPVFVQLPRLGIATTQQEKEDYIALFRYLAYLLGTPTEEFSSIERAKACMETMLLYELEPSPTSEIVCTNFIECLKDLPPFNVSSGFIEAGGRYFNGDKLCDAIKLGRPGPLNYARIYGMCWLLRFLAQLQRAFPALDRYMINYFRQLLHETIIQRGLKKASKFDFKYKPSLGTRVEKESEGRILQGGLVQRPVEAFLLFVFLFVCSLMFGLALLALKVATGVFAR